MYMKTNYLVLVLFAALAWGCGSDDDDNDFTLTTIAGAPTWQVDFSGNEVAPDWPEPNPSNYENWTIMLVEIEDALKPYSSADDLLALFVDDDLRGLSRPVINLSVGDDEDVRKDESDKDLYILKAYGYETGQNEVNMTLRYYCSRLKQMFSLTKRMKFDVDYIYGLDEDFIPQFTHGSAKYPVVSHLTITTANLLPLEVKFAAGDMLAAFVGDECRGACTLTGETALSPVNLTVFGREEGESYTLKYYQAATQSVYTLSKRF